MQKKLIALAVAGLVAAPAFAQSNVTVYGVADATFDVINVTSGTTTANGAVSSANNVGSYNRVSTNSSLIGFKGAEDLGNGLKAVFQFEATVGFDNNANAASNGFAMNRDSFVGAAGGFGTVIAGNLTGPTRLVGATMDVNAGSTGIGANSGLLGKAGNVLNGRLDSTSVTAGATGQVVNGTGVSPATFGRSSTQTSAFDTRFTNAVAYVSPTFSGFTFIGGYVANENKSAVANTSAFDLGLTYGNGPIWAALTHAEVDTKNAASVKPKNTRVAFKYDFGMADVRVLWDSTKVDTSVSGLNSKQNVWGLGTAIKAGAAGKVVAQYYKANDVTGGSTAGLNVGSNTGASLFELGYEHSLSKRTILKAQYARLNNKDAANYDFGINSTGNSSFGATLSGVQVGLRHSF